MEKSKRINPNTVYPNISSLLAASKKQVPETIPRVKSQSPPLLQLPQSCLQLVFTVSSVLLFFFIISSTTEKLVTGGKNIDIVKDLELPISS